MQKARICSFFGHRDTSETISEFLYQTVLKVIKDDNVSIFYVGKNGAFDSLARWAVTKAKTEFPHIKIYLVFAYLPTVKDTFLEEKYDGTVYRRVWKVSPNALQSAIEISGLLSIPMW